MSSSPIFENRRCQRLSGGAIYLSPAASITCKTLTTAFPDSSMVEHSAVNRVVAGSSPARGAMLTLWPPIWRPFLYRPLSSVDRAFASGAKGRRFDPVRGHHRSSKPRTLQTCSVRGFFFARFLQGPRCPFVFWLLHALVSGLYASIQMHARIQRMHFSTTSLVSEELFV